MTGYHKTSYFQIDNFLTRMSGSSDSGGRLWQYDCTFRVMPRLVLHMAVGRRWYAAHRSYALEIRQDPVLTVRHAHAGDPGDTVVLDPKKVHKAELIRIRIPPEQIFLLPYDASIEIMLVEE